MSKGIVRVVLACGLLCAGVAQAQAVRSYADPVELKETPVSGGESVVLNARFGELKAFNLVTGNEDTLKLRTYNGLPVGPTIRIKPGETLHMTLRNELPKSLGCQGGGPHPDPNKPHCFNYTNMHTHGLHVSPSGNSDNVLLTVMPGETKEYAFELPANHPAGTFWYHSHRHGSTALQVSSGMEGALIVEGTRTYAERAKYGGVADIDTVLKNADGSPVAEHTVLFQQVQYTCRDKGAIVPSCVGADGKPIVGEIPDYGSGQFGPGTWPKSMRFTSINGTVQPVVQAEAAKIYRFRMIHGGVRDTIGVHLTMSDATALPDPNLKPDQAQAWVSQHCLNGDVPQFEIAADGITRTSIFEKTYNVLQPGYRSDVLAVFPKAGIYCVTDDPLPPGSQINARSLARGPKLMAAAPALRERRLLALVTVSGSGVVKEPLRQFIGKQMYEGNAGLDEKVRRGLRKLDTAAFAPLPDLRDVPAAKLGHQENVFNIQLPDPKANPPKLLEFQVNGKPYSPERVDRTLTLGETDLWDISSDFDGHPFHIHVNSFQIEDILDPAGHSIYAGGHCTEMDLKDATGKAAPDPQYCDMQGTYKDTIFIKEHYHVLMRTRYDDFPGEFVLHCHILDHEDQGMMQNVRIVKPGEVDHAPFGHGMAMKME